HSDQPFSAQHSDQQQRAQGQQQVHSGLTPASHAALEQQMLQLQHMIQAWGQHQETQMQQMHAQHMKIHEMQQQMITTMMGTLRTQHLQFQWPPAAIAPTLPPLNQQQQQPSAPVQPQPSAPVQPQPSAPVQPQPSAPAQPQPSAPVQPQPSAPVQPQPSAPAQPQPNGSFSHRSSSSAAGVSSSSSSSAAQLKPRPAAKEPTFISYVRRK
ncbi:hypothetical protein BGX33_006397, partial [Mortierella sp. NVP41]